MSGPKPRPGSPMCPKVGQKGMRHNGHTPAGKTRLICNADWGGCGYTTTDPKARFVRKQSGREEAVAPLVLERDIRKTRRYVITAAQNATPVHKDFLASLLKYCEAKSAELI